MVFKQKFLLSFKPVIRYDYLQTVYNYPETSDKYAWICDLHFNIGYRWKNNSISLGYSIINTGKFINLDLSNDPPVSIEFPAISMSYVRTFKKRWAAEAKIMLNYEDFPTQKNLYNSTDPIYKREFVILSLGCTYQINLL